MAFKRVRRRLSTLAPGSNNRKHRATTQTRSTSGSTIDSKFSDELRATDENLMGRIRKYRQSITFDKLLTTDEAGRVLSLAPKQNSTSVSVVYNEAVQGDFNGHNARAASSNANDNFLSKAEDIASSRPITPGALVGTLPSGTSSRRTPVPLGKRTHGLSQKSQEGQVNDKTRLEAEERYYESECAAGASRQRSMQRSVNKDDYLFARGANPRTGIVTPGVHSTSSSYEEVELLKQRGIVPPSKWRQRGDQWVSLEIREPTPLTSPPKGPKTHHAGQPLRTPPRLTAGRYIHEISRGPYQKPSVSASLPEDVPTLEGVPATFPISPQNKFRDLSTTARPAQMTAIKRKPVGSAPRNNEGAMLPKQITPQGSTDTVIKRPVGVQLRSSSAPAPCSFNFETVDDVSKDFSKALPSVPNGARHPTSKTRRHIEIQEHFLGQQGLERVENVPGLRMSLPFKPDKELPCLPTSSGQFQLQVSKLATTMSDNVTAINDEKPRVKGRRGGYLACPFVRSMKMTVPRQYQLIPITSAGSSTTAPIMPIPTYDNPPPQKKRPSMPTRDVIGDPTQMYQARSVSENIKKASDIFTSPSVTMSINTRIPTHISTPQPRPRVRSHRVALEFKVDREQRLYQESQARIYPNNPRLWSRGMSSSVSTPMSGSRSRVQHRPQMPDRADAHVSSVPRMKLRRSNQVGFTGNHRQWRMTGTSEDAPPKKSDISAAITTKSEIDPNLVPEPLMPTLVDQNMVAPSGSRNQEDQNEFLKGIGVSGSERGDHLSQSSSLTRKRSRCCNGFVAGSMHCIAGHISTLASVTVTEDLEGSTRTSSPQQPCEDELRKMDATATLDLTSTEEEVDERDHTACCTECCTVEDCYEGCLGHPYPSIRSFGGSTFVNGVEHPSTPKPVSVSPSTSAPSSTIARPLKGKLSFVQGLRMRRTLRTRRSPDDGKTIKERCNILHSPAIELDSHPLSPDSFWGGGENAVTAAKEALRGRKHAATTPSTTGVASTNSPSANEAKRVISSSRLVIPKVRELRNRNTSESNMSPSSRASRSRNVSGTSILSIEIPHIFSNMGTVNMAGILEMLRVPFEAVAMWIQTHPGARQWLWKSVETAVDMASTVTKTGETVWEVSYVYSKTGRLRCKASGGIGRLVVDCGRSVGYLLIFVALAVCAGRVLGFGLRLAQGLFCIVKVTGWLLKKLGFGLLW